MNRIVYIKMKSFAVVLLTLFSVSFYACENDDNGTTIEQQVVLDNSSASLNVGEQLVVVPKFQPDVAPQRTYSWVTSNPEVVTVDVGANDYSVTLTARKAGTALVTLSSLDKELEATMDITVPGAPEDDGVLRVLAIGNSFSEDAIEQYLHELAAAEGVDMVIGNMYIGGASLELHLKNAEEGLPAYDYRKIDADGNKTSTPDMTLESAIGSEPWDYISLQQVSGHSGQFSTFEASLPGLLSYVEKHATHPDVKYILHQTWAYAENATHTDFPNYGSDQLTMYNAIVDAVRRAQIAYGMDYVVPSGTAIQNGRNTLIGDNFTRDGYHLDLGVGRYTAACTWFEALTGINVTGNSFRPDGLADIDAEIARHAAHAAVVHPDGTTHLPDYASGSAEPLSAPVYVNFGHNIVAKWNTLGDHHEGSSIGNLKDENDNYTDISLTVTQRFNTTNFSGESVTDTEFNMPAEVSSESYFGNTIGSFQDLEIKQSQVKLSGLDPGLAYNLCFFGSRAGVGDNRETQFTVAGENAAVVALNTSNNTTEIVCADGIQPDLNGEITITITAGPNNDNGSGFYYLSAMRLSPGE